MIVIKNLNKYVLFYFFIFCFTVANSNLSKVTSSILLIVIHYLQNTVNFRQTLQN